MRQAQRFGVGRALSLALLLALLSLRVWDPGPLEAVRLQTFDFYQLMQPRPAGPRPAVIVDIDEQSLKAYGQWPWARTLLADLVAKLTQLGAVAIGFDIVFPEPDRLSPQAAAAAFRDLDADTREKLRSLPSNDAVFAEAIRQSSVVLGQSGMPFDMPQPDGWTPPATAVAIRGPDPNPYWVTFPGLLRNIPILEEAAAGRGLFTIRSERDGIVRRVPLVMKAQGAVVPALTFEMLRVATRSGAVLISSDEAGIRSVAVPGIELPTDRHGQLWIHFNGHDSSRYVSVQDVLEGRVPPDKIAGKLVLVGTSAVGLLDLRTTPLDPVMPGVEVHAQILENALTNSVLSYPNYAVGVELVVAALVGLAIIVLAPVLSAATLVALGAAVIAVLVGFSWYYFSQQRLLLDVSFPLLSSFAIYLTLTFTNYFREQAQRQQIRSAFGQYLAPAVVEQLAQAPEKLVLGGEERAMTVMFSDVRGFTTIAESYKADPQGLTTLMNRFLTPLTNAIIAQNGTIDKYIGDAVMAFWNAPLDDPSHEANACAAALAMLRRVEELNLVREQEAKHTGQRFIPLHIGVGINTGRCVVGNMGSDLRFNYSVLGDAVNLASRLEGQTKSYGVATVVGSGTAAAVGDKFATLELDVITVKGKTEPETIYTVLGDEACAQSAAFQELSALNRDMLARYRRQEWDKALAALQACGAAGERHGLNGLYALYASRIHAFRQTPPPPDWNGVFAPQSK
jgi:adenylate cyclase